MTPAVFLPGPAQATWRTRPGRWRAAKSDTVSRRVTGVVLVPDTPTDNGHVVSADDVRGAAHGFLLAEGRIDIEHDEVPADVRVVESCVTLSEESIAGRQVPVGAWMLTIDVRDDALWQRIAAGDLCCYSIEASYNTARRPDGYTDVRDVLVEWVSIVRVGAVIGADGSPPRLAVEQIDPVTGAQAWTIPNQPSAPAVPVAKSAAPTSTRKEPPMPQTTEDPRTAVLSSRARLAKTITDLDDVGARSTAAGGATVPRLVAAKRDLELEYLQNVSPAAAAAYQGGDAA